MEFLIFILALKNRKKSLNSKTKKCCLLLVFIRKDIGFLIFITSRTGLGLLVFARQFVPGHVGGHLVADVQADDQQNKYQDTQHERQVDQSLP